MAETAEQLAEVRSSIAAATVRASRPLDSVVLIAVSKTFPVEVISEVVQAGQRVFGESKQQEAEVKIEALPSSLEWHFIGRIQRNKVRKLLGQFEVLHAVDSLRLAQHIETVAADLGCYPKVFLQINTAAEASKAGFSEDELRAAMPDLLEMKRLEILGLMSIPPAAEDVEKTRPWFAQLRELRDLLEQEYQVRLPFLSMGMSHDFEVAIEEGATHVRVGSAIFGHRSYRVEGELG